MIRYWPAYGLIPIIGILAGSFFLFVALKLRDASRRSWWLAFVSLLVIPVLIGLTVYQILQPIVKASIDFVPPQKGFRSFSDFSLRDFFYIAVFILLIRSVKKFHFASQALSRRTKVFLGASIVVFILPIILMMSFAYYKAFNPDDGFSKAQLEVADHVYKPTVIPGGRVISSEVVNNGKLAGKQNAIQVTYNIPGNKMTEENFGMLILLKQVDVKPGFDLRSFTSSAVPNSTTPEPVFLSIAVNNEAYFVEQRLSSDGMLLSTTLFFITPDNVLISTGGAAKTSREEIIQFSESLR